MWIRLESQHSNCTPVGIYQGYDSYHLGDFCRDVMLLPVPNPDNIQFPDDDSEVQFWFTEKGWTEFGTWFQGLFEPEAIEQDSGIVLVSIILDNDADKIIPCYQDEFQVALEYQDSINFSSNPKFVLNTLYDWERMERELALLSLPF